MGRVIWGQDFENESRFWDPEARDEIDEIGKNRAKLTVTKDIKSKFTKIDRIQNK